MAFQHTPYTIPLLLGAAIHLLLLLYLLAYRSDYERVPGARAASLLLIASMVWMLTYAFELSSVDLGTKLLWNKAQYFGSTALPALFLVYVLQYAGRERYVTRSTMAALSIIPVVTVLLAITNEAHGLIWQRVQLDTNGAYTVLINEHGAGFWLFVAYGYVVILVGVALLGLRFVHSRGFYRWQTAGLFAGAMVPVFASVLYVSGLNPLPHLNLPILALVATSMTVGWSVFRHHLFAVRPIARDAVIEEMDAAVLVVDSEDRIIDVNDAARDLLDGAGTITGTSIEAVWPEHAGRLAQDRSRKYREKITVESASGQGYYDLRVTPLTNRDGQQVGRLLVVRDVTDRERRERELERKNEQLEEFASVLSHDLRNPLSVARGYLEIAEEGGDESAYQRVEQAHDRIERIIEDMLTLARQGRSVSETEPVELSAIAADAWTNVSTPDGDLTIRENTTLEADVTRLLQLLENLFSNAVEHGSTSPGSKARQDAVEHGSTSPGSRIRQDAVGHSSTTPPSPRKGVQEDAARTSSGEPSLADAREDAVEHGSTSLDSRTRQDAVEHFDGEDTVEHSDGEVEVRVGATPEGFYVADDGPGIPEDDREDVFAYGHSSRKDGTGLGLSIVKNVSEAHGWEVDVSESWAGGARFDIIIR